MGTRFKLRDNWGETMMTIHMVVKGVVADVMRCDVQNDLIKH